MLIVSHDRYFMDRLVDHLFVFEGDGVIKDFPGNYSQYRMSLEEQVTEDKVQGASHKQQETRQASSQKRDGFPTRKKENLSYWKKKSLI